MEERVHKDNEENHHRRTRVEMLRLCFRLHGVDQLLDVGVTHFGLGEHFADEVNRSLGG